MRILNSFSLLLFCLVLSICCDSSKENIRQANHLLQEYYESEDISLLTEAHKLYKKSEIGKSKTKDISQRFVLYILFGDYEGARNYLSLLDDSDYPVCLNPRILRMQLDMYEQFDNRAYNTVDSLMHVFLKEYAKLYKDTKNDCWLQEMVAWYQDCCDESHLLEPDDLRHVYSKPSSFELDSMQLLIDQASFSIEKSYSEILRVRIQLSHL